MRTILFISSFVILQGLTAAQSCSDLFSKTSCDRYKKEGQCYKKNSLAQKYCRKTCYLCTGGVTTRPTTGPTICRDIFSSDSCIRYKSRGDCYKTGSLATKYCQKTCSLCSGGTSTVPPTSEPACRDGTAQCPEYKRRGYCSNNYFKTRCPKSCCTCGNEVCTTTPQPTLPTSPTRPTEGPTGPTRKPVGPTGSCGVSRKGHDYIVGGREASVGRWPWMVSLQTRGRHNCGGSILNANWILTAAHCVKSSATTYKVRVGWHNLNGRPSHGFEHQVIRKVVHSNFGTRGMIMNDNDIALLQLAKPIDFANEHVNPVCLPSSDEEFSGECVATGWGQTQGTGDKTKLREVTVPLYTLSACDKYWPGRISKNQICMGTVPPATPKTACMGDSGGPLVCKKGGRWVQAGVTSWGTRVCKGRPAVYTRLSKYISWINSNMR